jgi:hypothetical protein
VILPFSGHLKILGDILGCHNGGRGLLASPIFLERIGKGYFLFVEPQGFELKASGLPHLQPSTLFKYTVPHVTQQELSSPKYQC